MKRLLLAGLVAVALGGGQAKAATFNPEPVFPIGRISGTVSHQILKLDRVASDLAGRRAMVNCWSERGWTRFQAWAGAHHQSIDAEGFTFYAPRRIQLAPFICQILEQELARMAQQPLYTADAIMVLAHESAHASGIKVESQAECRAIETEPRAAQLLGVPKALAVRFQQIYRGTIYPNDLPRYRTPVCKAGLPGVVVADTLGSAANLRPLRRIGKAVVHALPPWRNLGGMVGPLEPCAPIKSRSLELARLSETLLGSHEFAVVTSATIRTRKSFATALARYRALPRCDLALRRLQARESHTPATISLGRMPNSIMQLAAQVRGFRDVYTLRGKRLNLDSIFVFDRTRRTMSTLFFSSPAGRLHPTIERSATAAILRASMRGG
jgi:hypothetical protein